MNSKTNNSGAENKVCVVCGKPITHDADDDQICDACEETRDELTNGKGEGDNE